MRTRFTDLVGCRLPIQQAGMGWVASPALAAAVAQAGGLGMIAMPLVPAPMLSGMLDSVEGAGAIGVNLLMPFLDLDCVDVAAAKARVVEFFYADPDAALVQRAKAGGAAVLWQVGSLEEARAAVEAGCDALVVQGTEAGGHVRGRLGLLPLLSDVLDAVDVPVVAAGGIAGRRSMAACLAAGADAVRIGTLLCATQEADIHPEYVEALLRARGEDTVLTEAFSTMWSDAPHRVLRSCVEAATSIEQEVVGEARMGDMTMPVPRFAPMAPTTAMTGEIGAMALYAGEAVGEVTRVRPAGEVVRELAEAAEILLRERAMLSSTMGDTESRGFGASGAG